MLQAKKAVYAQAGLLDDRTYGTLRHVAGMVGDGDSYAGGLVAPDLMAAPGGAVEGETRGSKLADHFDR